MKLRHRQQCLALVAGLLIISTACAGRPQQRVGTDPVYAPGEQPRPPLLVPYAGGGAGMSLRVGLVVGHAEIRIRAPGPVQVLDARGKTVARIDRGGELQLRRFSAGLQIRRGGRALVQSGERALLLRPESGGAPWGAKGDQFPGEMLALSAAGGGVTLVNRVDLESYLKGVVPWEIGRPGRESLEAVKAQAIAARTYTLAHLGRRAELGFDVWDSVEDQVYRGASGTSDITDRAVEQTEGLVLEANAELVQAYYSSTCGGHGSSIEDVWPRAPIAYLTGGRDAPRREGAWCRESPHFRWAVAWSAKELGEVIRQQLPTELGRAMKPQEIGVLQSLEVVDRDRSGRAQLLRIHTDRDSFDVWGDRIRWVLRPVRGRFAILKSTMLRVENIRIDGKLVGVRVDGGGFGHGVGLCQTGALAMARAGRDAEEILAHYYRGSRVTSYAPSLALP